MTNFDVVLPTRKCRKYLKIEGVATAWTDSLLSVTNSSCQNVFSSFGQTLYSYLGVGVMHMNVSVIWPSVMHMYQRSSASVT